MANFTIALKKKELVADETWAFWFEKPAEFQFEAGQYIAMVVPKMITPDKRGPVRSLSIASAPCETELMFAMRNTHSPFKESLLAMNPGETVQVTRPTGFFTMTHADDSKPIVFLIGGIGITPVRSILKQAEHDGSEREFTLFYSNRLQKDATFLDEIRAMKVKHLQVVSSLSQDPTPCATPNEERGYICQDMLAKYCRQENFAENWYYLVGAPTFISAMEAMLANMGVTKNRIVTDPFTGLTPANVEKSIVEAQPQK